MTKYNWSNVPKEVKWLAVDKGEDFAYGFKVKPFMEYGMWSVKNLENNVVDGVTNLCLVFKGNWQDSLEERPAQMNLPETVVKSLGEVA